MNSVTFFERMYEAYQCAKQNVGVTIDRYYSIGGSVVRLQFAGNLLIPCITTALEHLETSITTEPAITICLWDAKSTNVSLPLLTWPAEAYDTRGEIRDFKNSSIRVACHFDNFGGHVISLFDTERNLALYCMKDASQNPFYQYSSPLLTIFSWWVRTKACQYIHAAAIGIANGGVLLVGRGGSGKSTTSLTTISSDLMYAGDDYCLLTTNPEPYVYSLYNSGKLATDHLLKFPHLLSKTNHTNDFGAEKAIVFIHQHYPNKIINGFPIRAIIKPQITDVIEPCLIPSSSGVALRALAPSTLFQLAGAGASEFAMMADFVKQVPCYTLKLGKNLDKIPSVILNLLKELS